jgi:protein O-GlcNAc transferase
MAKAVPSQADFQRAVGLYRRGQLQAAESQCQQALKQQPRSLPGLHLLGVIQLRLRKTGEAVETFDRLLAIDAQNAEALNHRGVALQQLVRLQDARASFEAALRLRPAYPEALGNLATVLIDLDELQLALASIDRALGSGGPHPANLTIRGNVLGRLGRDDEALQMYDQALALDPRAMPALIQRAALLHLRGWIDEAVLAYQRLREVAPDRPDLPGLLLEVRLAGCDWTGFTEASADITRRVERGEPASHPFPFLWYCDSPALQLTCAETYAAREWPVPRMSAPAFVRRRRDRIRLAYLSPDFRAHPVAYGFASLLERHDRSRFEVLGLSYGLNDGSEMRGRVEHAVDRFIDLREHGLDDTVAALRGMEIDILVDLAGFTGGGRAGNRGVVLAHRVAPIQVNHQGFGTGAPFFDYIICDQVTTPDHLLPFHREKVVRLPECSLPVDCSQIIAPLATDRAAQGLPEKGFVFCCFNSSHKILPAMFDVWARLLNAVPGSVLWLRESNRAMIAHLRQQARKRGIAEERLVFAGYAPLAEHLARHRLADLFLDTSPFGAHTTGWHALWAGLPLISIAGQSFASRASVSLLASAGLADLGIDSVQAYEALALDLAHNPERLTSVRARLQMARATAPLFDSERYRRHLEAAYGEMYEGWLAGKSPAAFDVPAEPARRPR